MVEELHMEREGQERRGDRREEREMVPGIESSL